MLRVTLKMDKLKWKVAMFYPEFKDFLRTKPEFYHVIRVWPISKNKYGF